MKGKTMTNRSKTGRWAVAVALCVSPLIVYSATQQKTESAAEVKLPTPATSGGMSLTEALAKRRSQRSFESKPLTSEQISQLCWAAQGVTDEATGKRTAPSALKLFAVQVFVVDDTGAYEYVPASHVLKKLDVEDAHAKLKSVIQPTITSAPVHIVLTMEPEHLKARARDRAERYSLLEVGHVAQNILLQATAMGLAGVPAGGIDEQETARALNLQKGLRPVYVIPVGYTK